MARSIQLAFGDVKNGGRFEAAKRTGELIQLVKINPVLPIKNRLAAARELAHSVEVPPCFNALEEGGTQALFYLPNEAPVRFFPDYQSLKQ